MTTRRITVTLPQAEFLKIQENAESKKMTLAESMRQLIGFGLQVEANLKGNSTRLNPPAIKDFPQDTHQDLWKTQLQSTLESRYLARYILDHIMKDDPKREAILQAVKKKSEQLTEELLAK